jgi:hypothetical protein
MRSVLLILLVLLTSLHVVGQDLRFIQNKGQWEESIDFQAQVPGGRVGVSAKGFSVMLVDMEELDRRHMAGHGEVNESTGSHADDPIDVHFFKINLIGANTQARAIVNVPLDGYYNYFIGNDTCRWASDVKAFSSIVYENIYTGIDFRVSSVGNNLKYDFIVKAGADPSQIKIEYEGSYGVEKSGDDLLIKTVLGPLTDQKPFTYHANGKNKETVASQYRLRDNIASFSFPDGYDECRELVIDPLLIFSTYSGSTADNWGSTATPGEHGTLYSAGVTRTTDNRSFPATPGAFQLTNGDTPNNSGTFDMAIIKYDSLGKKFLYATHLGGNGNDSPQSLVVDKATGDLLVLGISASNNFPVSANGFDQTFNDGPDIANNVLGTTDGWDIVLTRFTSDGKQLVGSTYLGGTENDGLNLPHDHIPAGRLSANYGDEMRGDVITDDAGNVFISSVTFSNNFPIVGGFDNSFNGGISDGLIAKLTPNLSSIIWSSYIGGSGLDASYSIKFDPDSNLVIAGGTMSTNFPVTAGAYQTTISGDVDGWIARIKKDGSAVMNATFTGTQLFDQVYFVDLNSAGNIFCFGQTTGQMPITAGVYHKENSGQFLQRFSADLSTLEMSTVFGTSSTNGNIIPNISPTAFMVNDCGNIFMAGWGGAINTNQGFWPSSTSGMEVTNDAIQLTTAGSDFYFIVLDADATQLKYATFYGGKDSKTHVDGGTSRFDKYGIVYHSVCAGCQAFNEASGPTSDFPTTAGAKSRINASNNCNNAAFKFDLSTLVADFETNNLARDIPGFNNVCYPDTIVFENKSAGGRIFQWTFDDGTVVNQNHLSPRFVLHQYKQTGQYKVKLKITDLTTCSQTDSITKVINFFKDNIVVGPDAMMCEADGFQLTASGGVTYEWTTEDGSFTSSEPNPFVNPTKPTSYFVTVVDENGCSKTDTLTVGIKPYVIAAFETYDMDFNNPGLNIVCNPDSLRFKNQSVNAINLKWDFDDGIVIDRAATDTTSIIHRFPGQRAYAVKLKAINLNSCNKVDSVTKVINYYEHNILVGDDAEICEGTTFQLTASGGNTYSWISEDQTFSSPDQAPIVKPPHTTKYFVTVNDGNNCVKKDSIEVVVLDSVNLQWEYHLMANCVDRPKVRVQSFSVPGKDVTFYFDFGDGTVTSELKVDHEYEDEGTYYLKFFAQNKHCLYEKTIELPIYELKVPNIFTPEGSPGVNDYFEIGFKDGAIAPHTVGVPVQLIIVDRWGKTVFESDDYHNDWNGSNLSSGVYFVHMKVGEFASCKTWLQIVK